MKIDTLVVGELHENCYIVTKNNKSIIIDPGDESKKILAFCQDLNVVEVLVTHHHFDHVGALKDVLSYYNLKENINSKSFNYKLIKTPGHTKDSISFYFPDDAVLFSGDFLFKSTIGRTDLEGGSDLDMKESLQKIKDFPDDTVVFPGHGSSTILEEEKKLFNLYYSMLTK